MYFVIVFAAFVLACICGSLLGFKRGALAMLVPLVALGAVVAARMSGEALILLAAYGGAMILVSTALGLAVGRIFRRR